MTSTDIAEPKDLSTSASTDEAQMRHNQEIIAMLKSWEADDPDEQRETLEALLPALERERFSLDGRTFPV
jgi:hypothetical protein